jgi:hypothetical protein
MSETNREFLAKMSADGTSAWMAEQIKVLKDGARALESRRAQFLDESVRDHNVTQVNILSWFLNDIANIERNLRLDLAVNHASALALSQVTK